MIPCFSLVWKTRLFYWHCVIFLVSVIYSRDLVYLYFWVLLTIIHLEMVFIPIWTLAVWTDDTTWKLMFFKEEYSEQGQVTGSKHNTPQVFPAWVWYQFPGLSIIPANLLSGPTEICPEALWYCCTLENLVFGTYDNRKVEFPRWMKRHAENGYPSDLFFFFFLAMVFSLLVLSQATHGRPSTIRIPNFIMNKDLRGIILLK